MGRGKDKAQGKALHRHRYIFFGYIVHYVCKSLGKGIEGHGKARHGMAQARQGKASGATDIFSSSFWVKSFAWMVFRGGYKVVSDSDANAFYQAEGVPEEKNGHEQNTPSAKRK